MKTMFDVKKFGASNKMKVLVFLMLCAIWAMAWTFVKVGHHVEIDQARLADVGEQLVLSQRIAKYALSSTTGDMDAFTRLEASKNKFSAIIKAKYNIKKNIDIIIILLLNVLILPSRNNNNTMLEISIMFTI